MTAEPAAELDLDAYLARVGYAGPLRPTADVLADLHLAHATRIPFENLDILLGRPIRIDLGSVQTKLVAANRGGYCFEQNTLLAAGLIRLGFRVTPLAARVRYNTDRVLPRTHMLLKVDLADGPWLADVGFGKLGLLHPLPMAAGREVEQFRWAYRLAREGDGTWVLQARQGDGWLSLYAFTLEPQHPVDFEVANYYVSTHPDSRFTRMLTVQRPGPEVRHSLIDRELTTDRGGEPEVRSVGEEELLPVLAETFGLEFSPGTRFNVTGIPRVP
jgi:N-hydroxyarylamine O-acetyltransferase